MRAFARFALPGLVLAVAGSVAGQIAETTPAAPPPAAPQNQVVLTVNGEEVRAADVGMAMQGVAARARQSGTQMNQDDLFAAATRQVVETRLLAQEARRQAVQADQERVGQAMREVEQQAGGRETLDAQLQRGGMSYDQLKERVTENDMIEQLITGKIEPGVQVADQEVTDFYTDHPDLFKEPEKVRARHILITTSAADSEEQKATARTKAEKAHERAVAGEDFAALAKELSQCPSAPQGGDLGFFSADDMVKPFTDAAFALEPGKISPVVESQFGYHVIKLEERRPAGARSLAEVREQLKTSLVRQKVSAAVGALLEKLSAEAKIVPVGDEPAPTPVVAPPVG